MDCVERRIASIGMDLEVLRRATLHPSDGSEEWRWHTQFKGYGFVLDLKPEILTSHMNRALETEMLNLRKLGEEWLIRKVADYEDEKQQIANIFERVNDARVRHLSLSRVTALG